MTGTDLEQPGGGCASVVGLQWGDEGKGKIVDLLAGDFDAVVRYNGGANAGHSVNVGTERYALHLVPSGILYPGRFAIIGNGVVVDPEQLIKEIDGLQSRGVDTSGLVISSRAHVVTPLHKEEDAHREQTLTSGVAFTSANGDADARAGTAIGTTKRGIGPCYAEKAQRAGALRMGDLLKPDVIRERVSISAALRGIDLSSFDTDSIVDMLSSCGRRLGSMIKDTTYLLHALLNDRQRVLFEGGNATLLDVDHGTFPFVTSSNASALGIGPGTGVPPQRIDRIVGVMKSYCTRVGSGPMPTELHDDTAHRIRERGREYGTTTGRPRRVGWLDLVALRYSVMVNGVTEIALTMLDVLSGHDDIMVCTHYMLDGQKMDRFLPDSSDLARAEPVYERLAGFSEDISGIRHREQLPIAAQRFLETIETHAGVPITIASVGPGRSETITA
ncbi:MAG: adenylosuccinate synthase [Phycisphaeraceae bacterium]|nr:adenylosuccinate synthase [Phycisphaerales bacterium]MCB9860262.1 adenylosuccinate synthase [Phycisphaeraceae bacterium]